jgi:hypothetical protein
VVSGWATQRLKERIFLQPHIQEGGIFLGVSVPILSPFVGSDVTSPPPRSDTLDLMLWLTDEVVRLEEPCDSKAG